MSNAAGRHAIVIIGFDFEYLDVNESLMRAFEQACYVSLTAAFSGHGQSHLIE